ncbi:isoleucine-tRNA ligase [Coemansia javaensis]|uniref:Isoleucine--tRNA ligase, mitochondrial n=1 Tax=Coemansia javaensis TaxID=2761396 RepID=A0A9W8HCR0_9FUNG|nr:isoleucine-tRNA ligase [Coemansia javaensis]
MDATRRGTGAGVARAQAYGTQAKNAYAHTLRLPRTDFPLRADAARREAQFRERCTDALYRWQLENNRRPQFVLHDGPPYANGDLHIGHFMNKVLKDVINRYQVMQGRRVVYVPGFDTHGLPIEQKALATLKGRDPLDSLDPLEIRRLARSFALRAVARQTEGFREYGVMGDWANPYLTLDPEYEAGQLEVFKEMVLRGYIYRQKKPVYWSPSSRTALAEAELEYNDEHTSTSVYVKMPLTAESAAKIGAQGGASALVWTTTPWTLPANSAIAVHPDLQYVLAAVGGSQLVVGRDRLGEIVAMAGEPEVRVLRELSGRELAGLSYSSTLRGAECPILLADYVAGDSGTGLVHSAPGHGKEDYELGLASGLEIYSPVDDHGRFTGDAGPDLAGKEVLGAGTAAVIGKLEAAGLLFHRHAFTHSYPYDWRTKKPVIQRATPQWFADLADLRDGACEALRDVAVVVPESGRRRLRAFVAGRSEWCISRQRVWGVPIPVLYDAASGEPLLTAESIDHIIQVVRTRGGTDAWWTLPVEELVAPAHRGTGATYVRGTDTMDVWFDSGSSWRVMQTRMGCGAGARADVYLEGSDQHRGWFQSSLLTSAAVRGAAPYRALVTHGFTLDEHGRKMSKSEGNTLEPGRVIHGGRDKKKEPAYGVDLLRLVVGSTDYTHDVSFGPTVFAGVSDTIRKIRGTVRFMLGNLDGFTADMAVPYRDMESIDRYALHELYHFKQRAKAAFDGFEFFRALQAVNNFTNVVLSAFYFDVSKDRLYAHGVDDVQRRSAQTALYHILVNYTTTLAPVTCHLAEEVWEFLGPTRRALGKDTWSVFQERWDQSDAQWDDPALAERWAALRQIRGLANRAIEAARQARQIGSSLEAELSIYLPVESTQLGRLLQASGKFHGLEADNTTLAATKKTALTTANLALLRARVEDDLRLACVTSRVSVHDASQAGQAPGGHLQDDVIVALGSETAVRVVCRRSPLHKCPRCWNFHSEEEGCLCSRCRDVVGGGGPQQPRGADPA